MIQIILRMRAWGILLVILLQLLISLTLLLFSHEMRLDPALVYGIIFSLLMSGTLSSYATIHGIAKFTLTISAIIVAIICNAFSTVVIALNWKKKGRRVRTQSVFLISFFVINILHSISLTQSNTLPTLGGTY